MSRDYDLEKCKRIAKKVLKHILSKYDKGAEIPYHLWKVGITNDPDKRYKEIIGKLNRKIAKYNLKQKSTKDRFSKVNYLRYWASINSGSKVNALTIERSFCKEFKMSLCKIQKFHAEDSKYVYVFRIPESIVVIGID